MIAEITLVALVRLITGVRAHWDETDGPPDAAVRHVFFANHASHLDFVAIWASLPWALRARSRPVAARDYWEKGALRRYLAHRIFRAVLIDRGNVSRHFNPIDHMLEALAAGDSIILFPEGTRTPDPLPRAFKPGLYHLARRVPDTRFVPVYLENLNRVLPKGESLPLPILSHVRFGPALDRRPDEPKPDFLDRARQSIIALANPGDPAR